MAETIDSTEVLCHDCQCNHPARLVLDGSSVLGVIDCPQRPKQLLLSQDAELFMQLRRQSGVAPNFRAPEPRPFFFHHLSITDDCDCNCPVCFADSGSHRDNFYLSLAEAGALVQVARHNGARTVILVGGEPTLHPQLIELIRLLRAGKLRVWLATNGLRIAREPALAFQLKKAGLEKVSLQLDSFHPATHQIMRGHGKIADKLEAARLLAAAGLDLGLICTVTSHNLAEIPSYCRQVLSWQNLPSSVIFQGAAHTGRLTVDVERHITREEIIDSLVRGEAVPGLKTAHFWPIPLFRPLSVFVHPDCAANTVAVVSARGVEPVAAYADMDRFLRLATEARPSSSPGTRKRYLLEMALKSLRVKGWRLLGRHLLDRLQGKRGARIVVIGTGAFLRRDFHDLARVQRCGSGALSGDGCESLCSFHSRRLCNGI